MAMSKFIPINNVCGSRLLGRSGAGLGGIRQSSVAEVDGKTSLPFIEPSSANAA